MLATGRSIHSAFRTWNSTLLRLEGDRALARAAEHRLGLVGDDHPAHRRDQLRREHARLAEARRQLEHALARLRHGRVDHPVRDRGAELAHRAPAGASSRRPPLPSSRRLASRCAFGSKLIAIAAPRCAELSPFVPNRRSSLRRSLPERVRGSGSSTNDTCLGTLCAGEPAGAVGTQRLTVEHRPRPRHDDRRDGLAPVLVGAGHDRRLEHVGVGLEHRLDLRGRDVLAAADDRVGLAPGHPQPALVVEHAEVAGVQPAVAGERAGRDGRPGDEDLPLLPGAQGLLRIRRRIDDPHARAEQWRSGAQRLGGGARPAPRRGSW